MRSRFIITTLAELHRMPGVLQETPMRPDEGGSVAGLGNSKPLKLKHEPPMDMVRVCAILLGWRVSGRAGAFWRRGSIFVGIFVIMCCRASRHVPVTAPVMFGRRGGA